ncbi:MAG: D-alanyl-D-alanine carboxypeptidase/D-alanyl-D-alanine-endopeptidase [Synechococcus sp.]|nr:D-alanyl-D-alanine carboxypeptidase/D-alanyl-D-alanine-endopeptidase [Synechococcus sp.]
MVMLWMRCPIAMLLLGGLASPSLAQEQITILDQLGAPTSSVPFLSPPPPTQNRALPSLQQGGICQPLQTALMRHLGSSRSAWSISVVDPAGRLIGDVNGDVARIPASNQKLITTAFALDRLGPDYRLKTKLLRRSDGTLELVGQGDPDLGLAGVQRFAMAALGQGGSRGAATGPVQLMLREEPQQRWWPHDWHPADRAEAYGAPITRLALTSNALDTAVRNPAARFQTLLQREIQRQGGQVSMTLLRPSASDEQTVVLHEETSAPMHALMSLSNTESHNFTAEVLLRQAADEWDVRQASSAAMQWMRSQNLPLSGVRIADGSGLSRNNRLTSRTLSALLLRMKHHPLSAYYQASMAIAGQRGTLRNLFKGTGLEGRFHGKTGTLTGVRSVSGLLQTKDGLRFVSMISNGASSPNTTMEKVLLSVQQLSPCPSSF